MNKRNYFSICSLYAISPIHAGSGTSTGAVDLPIQRERHTNWPHIQASGVKGAFRAHFRNFFQSEEKDLINFIFGSDDQDGWDKKDDSCPGAVSISDARILAFPVRSNIAPFVWVTCPAVLNRLNKDLEFAGWNDKIDLISGIENENAAWISNDPGNDPQQVVLEEAVVTVTGNLSPQLLTGFFGPKKNIDRLLLVSDEMFDYVVSSCTEIQTQIKIDSEKGTARVGSLRYEELLPTDTLLYTVMYYSQSSMNDLQAENVKNYLEETVKGYIQIGGDETLGRGICRLSWFEGGA